MAWPEVQAKADKAQAQYKFVDGSWLPPLLGYLILAAIFLPYCIALLRGTLHPILPFVSQAAGSPPQSGMFCILLVLSSLVAFVGLHLLYMSLRVRSARLPDSTTRARVRLLNRALLVAGHAGIMGIVGVAAYPLDFHRHNEDWWDVTIVPHLAGAVSLFAGGISFCGLLTAATRLLRPCDVRLFRRRLLLIGLILAASALQGLTVADGFMDEYHSADRLESCVMKKIEYSPTYVVSSLCEWTLLVSFALFFMTIREEAGHISFTMTIQVDGDQQQPDPIGAKKVAGESRNDENHNVGGDQKEPQEEREKADSH